jgi:hypothetical protein
MGILDLLRQWPLVQQVLTGGDGTGPEAMSAATRALRPRNEALMSRVPSAPTAVSAAVS